MESVEETKAKQLRDRARRRAQLFLLTPDQRAEYHKLVRNKKMRPDEAITLFLPSTSGVAFPHPRAAASPAPRAKTPAASSPRGEPGRVST